MKISSVGHYSHTPQLKHGHAESGFRTRLGSQL